MMIFSRVGSISRSSRSRNVLRVVGGVRSAASTDVVTRLPLIGAIDHRSGVGLGFPRGYLAAIGAHREFVSKTNLSDLHYTLVHPGIRRFFSNEAPDKKNYETFLPKEKKEIPKGSEEKFEFRDVLDSLEFLKDFLMVTIIYTIFCGVLPELVERQLARSQEPGLVDHIDVSNKSVISCKSVCEEQSSQSNE